MTVEMIEDDNGGYAQLIDPPPFTALAGTLILHTLFVPPKLRGQGRGTALLRRALEIADERGKPIMLAAIPETTVKFDVVAWYARYGFTVTNTGLMMERPAHHGV